MTDAHPLLKDLTEQLLKEVMQHVLEVSVEQYQIIIICSESGRTFMFICQLLFRKKKTPTPFLM